MSLRFCYEPLKPIHIIRHQRVYFTVGNPKVTFRDIKLPTQKEHKIKEPREPSIFLSREKKPPAISLALQENSFNGCYEFLKSLKNSKSSRIRSIISLKGTAQDKQLMYSEQTEGIPDISMIEDKLLQCQYSTISEFFEDLTSYFDGIVTVYNSSSEYPDYGRNAEKVLREIKKIIENLSSEETSSRTIGGIEKQIGKLVETDVGSPGLPPERTDLTKLAQSLNQLKGKERIKAEFIIKLHCPFLPYYSSGVDLAQLPYPAIESLQQLVNV